jgi:3-deoxy-D-manno-octulosonic-acid transferase
LVCFRLWYGYGQLAYIGGGFGVGIHNTLEAATYGIPVLFGPNFKKFQEAKDLVQMDQVSPLPVLKN